MNHFIKRLTALLLVAGACGASQANSDLAAIGIDLDNVDHSVRPQDDLYRAVNGRWLQRTEIPADKSNYGAFTLLADTADEQLRTIVESLAASGESLDDEQRKVRDVYASFMDVGKIDSLGIKPILPELEAIAAMSDRSEIPAMMARLVRMGVSMPLLPYVHQDARDASRYVGDFYQGGLSLPDRDFYLIQDDKFRGIRGAYVDHLQAMWTLAGMSDPAQLAIDVMALESEIARAQWDKVERRDPIKRYNPYPVDSLEALAPALQWPRYLEGVGFNQLGTVLISQPSYVSSLSGLLRTHSIDRWKAYLSWRLLSHFSSTLATPLADEHFKFFGTRLNGISEQEPRWKRGIAAVEYALDEALGRLYVAEHFPPENKARMEKLVQNLIIAFGKAIDSRPWMSPSTKAEAHQKLARFNYKIGYPDQWRDYTSLEIVANDALGNQVRAAQFEYQRDLDKLGQPIDRGEWHMTPQTVNAYYNPEKNEIVFPAAILQPPFFNFEAEEAVNYGAIGAVIGHEISHGFDDRGSQYDGEGNLRNWWTDEDRARFDALGARLAAQFDAYEPLPGRSINGKFTLGENIADLGGLRVAHLAYRLSLGAESALILEGLSGDQRLLMGWAQVWRRLYREENLLNRLRTDPHSPSEYRCNGVMVNLDSFHEAFRTQPGDKLYKKAEDRITIW